MTRTPTAESINALPEWAVTRRPASGRRFSWFRARDEHYTHYRLFRRSLQGRVHMHTESFSVGTSRSAIARHLKRMRRELLDEVDAIDLRFLGVTEEAA